MGKKVTYSAISVSVLFVFLLGCLFVLFVFFVRIKSFHKKRFEIALMT